MSKLIIKVSELGLIVLVFLHVYEPYPIGTKIIFDILQIFTNPGSVTHITLALYCQLYQIFGGNLVGKLITYNRLVGRFARFYNPGTEIIY